MPGNSRDSWGPCEVPRAMGDERSPFLVSSPRSGTQHAVALLSAMFLDCCSLPFHTRCPELTFPDAPVCEALQLTHALPAAGGLSLRDHLKGAGPA